MNTDTTKPLPADQVILDLLREDQELTVAELAGRMEVTGTAVRQRLGRLMSAGYVCRVAPVEGRGRPKHRYSLTEEGRQAAGSNFRDLATALWSEMRSIPDISVRRGLLQRIAQRMAGSYADEVDGTTLQERLRSIAQLLSDRDVPFTVEPNEAGELPILSAKACPYPGLAEQDPSVCAMERMMISEMLGQTVQLSECRLDGDACCSFQVT